jgi:hypothetical protein
LEHSSTKLHHCFANRILAHLALNSDEADQFSGQLPEDVICGPSCPCATTLNLPETNRLVGDDDNLNGLHGDLDDAWEPPEVSRILFGSANSITSSLASLHSTPLLSELGLDSLLTLNSPLGVSTPSAPPTSENAQIIPAHAPLAYIPSIPPPFSNLQLLIDDLESKFDDDLARSFLNIQGPSVSHIAVGLVDFLKKRRQHPNAPYSASNNPQVHPNFKIVPSNAKLCEIFQMLWSFKAYVIIYLGPCHHYIVYLFLK